MLIKTQVKVFSLPDTCPAPRQVLSAATDFVVLAENVSEVAYVGAALLIEYTVGRHATDTFLLSCVP